MSKIYIDRYINNKKVVYNFDLTAHTYNMTADLRHSEIQYAKTMILLDSDKLQTLNKIF